jgi:threonine/homoserine/homoserine lactone efflux protein
VLGALARRLLHGERSARIFNIVMGIVLAASVAMMFV